MPLNQATGYSNMETNQQYNGGSQWLEKQQTSNRKSKMIVCGSFPACFRPLKFANRSLARSSPFLYSLVSVSVSASLFLRASRVRTSQQVRRRQVRQVPSRSQIQTTPARSKRTRSSSIHSTVWRTPQKAPSCPSAATRLVCLSMFLEVLSH